MGLLIFPLCYFLPLCLPFLLHCMLFTLPLALLSLIFLFLPFLPLTNHLMLSASHSLLLYPIYCILVINATQPLTFSPTFQSIPFPSYLIHPSPFFTLPSFRYRRPSHTSNANIRPFPSLPKHFFHNPLFACLTLFAYLRLYTTANTSIFPSLLTTYLSLTHVPILSIDFTNILQIFYLTGFCLHTWQIIHSILFLYWSLIFHRPCSLQFITIFATYLSIPVDVSASTFTYLLHLSSVIRKQKKKKNCSSNLTIYLQPPPHLILYGAVPHTFPFLTSHFFFSLFSAEIRYSLSSYNCYFSFMV